MYRTKFLVGGLSLLLQLINDCLIWKLQLSNLQRRHVCTSYKHQFEMRNMRSQHSLKTLLNSWRMNWTRSPIDFLWDRSHKKYPHHPQPWCSGQPEHFNWKVPRTRGTETILVIRLPSNNRQFAEDIDIQVTTISEIHEKILAQLVKFHLTRQNIVREHTYHNITRIAILSLDNATC